jgi:glyoxylate reductase
MKIFLTRMIPDEGIKMLRQHDIEVDIYEKDKKIPRRQLLKRVRGVDVIASILTEQIDAEVMDAAGSNLKMIANYAVGYNNIDLDAAKERDIIVTNAPNPEISETVAEHTVALILALAHRIVETDRFTRAGRYKNWGPELFLGSDLYGKTLGIIGAGSIGSAVAKRLHKGFDMKVVYNSHKPNKDFEKEFDATFMDKMDLLKVTDVVTLHVPLLDSTRHLIAEEELNAMKKTAFLINTARGPVVDELALTKALMEDRIAGAGLDVYECEPFIDCNSRDRYSLRNLDNVVLTPHTASASIETRQAMGRAMAANIIALKEGKEIPHQVS